MARAWLLASALWMVLAGCVSPLERAVKSGDKQEVQRVLSSGANVNGNYWVDWKSPIYLAIKNNDLDTLKLLHGAGASLPPGSLIVAGEYGSSSVYAYLVSEGASLTDCFIPDSLQKWWPKEQDLQGVMPALGAAIARRDHSSIATLVDLGAPLNTLCHVPLGKDFVFSAILAAAIVGDADTLEFLLKKGVNPNTLSTAEQTPLEYSAKFGYYESARVLLAHGAFHTYRGEQLQPIEIARKYGHEDIVKLLEFAGARFPTRITAMDRIDAASKAVANHIGDIVLIAGALWAIEEGSKYAVPPPQMPTPVESTGASVAFRAAASSQKACHSDFDCKGAFEVCVKPVALVTGTCIRDDSMSGKRGESIYTGGQPFGRPLNTSCPTGYVFNYVYEVCTR